MPWKNIISLEEFENSVKELSFVVFYVSEIRYFQLISSTTDAVSEMITEFNLETIKVDLAQAPAIPKKYNITKLPIGMFFKDGIPLDAPIGAENISEVKKWLLKYCSTNHNVKLPNSVQDFTDEIQVGLSVLYLWISGQKIDFHPELKALSVKFPSYSFFSINAEERGVLKDIAAMYKPTSFPAIYMVNNGEDLKCALNGSFIILENKLKDFRDKKNEFKIPTRKPSMKRSSTIKSNPTAHLLPLISDTSTTNIDLKPAQTLNRGASVTSIELKPVEAKIKDSLGPMRAQTLNTKSGTDRVRSATDSANAENGNARECDLVTLSKGETIKSPTNLKLPDASLGTRKPTVKVPPLPSR